MNALNLLANISRQWGLELVRWREDLPLAGSPERTSWRCVVENRDGRLYVLEKIASRVYDRKRRILSTLQQLDAFGLTPIAPYLPDINGETIPLISHGLWQLCPYVLGIDLDRPAYAMEKWRGDAAADFLIRLNGILSQQRLVPSPPVFSLSGYIRDLFAVLSKNDPVTATHYRPFLDHLERKLFPTMDKLPLGFCHGDYHPLNIIWGRRTIRAVIDWEFCGIKTEAYDTANLIGCLGMEDPCSLSGPFVSRLVCRLRDSGIYTEESWKTLPDLILATRFAWLSEWMRKNDRPMIQLEADYMSILLDELSL
ncbi:aminoglycoside phosphotransferase [Desulfosarcina widdelii]|uniref:Aminoglycoside phosphotransferase n=1 Tax=Desulfosarcina widdelii TaxID=947919 RepID=A0A5K7ZC43_9BACT|nr:aminoglycoside phosphotransferase family protein [Desulfosarcina widdelii]BBO77313.1 aminoglycoside phosphotransferase [Desulfosarcina widdelii]